MKILTVATLALLLTACNSPVAPGPRVQEMKSEEFAQVMAKRDGKDPADPKAIAPYVEQFNAIASKCTESPTVANSMAANLATKDAQAGQKADYLDWMRSFSEAADSLEVKPSSCQGVYEYFLSSLEAE